MKLLSHDFEDNNIIPSKFTCDGKNISPHLCWVDIPNGVKSLALVVTDPDALGGWIHWQVYDVSKETKEMFPDKQIITVEGLKIGLIHGSGSPFNILSRVENSFQDSLDMYIFGHTHSAYNKIHKGKVFFNPGSPTDKFFAKFNSYGILNIKEGNIGRRIIKI